LVYDALIGELYRFGGSVIGFSGDAITCWLDGDDGLRATACALSMQATMTKFQQVRINKEFSLPLAMKRLWQPGLCAGFWWAIRRSRCLRLLAGLLWSDWLLLNTSAKRRGCPRPGYRYELSDRLDISQWRSDQMAAPALVSFPL